MNTTATKFRKGQRVRLIDALDWTASGGPKLYKGHEMTVLVVRRGNHAQSDELYVELDNHGKHRINKNLVEPIPDRFYENAKNRLAQLLTDGARLYGLDFGKPGKSKLRFFAVDNTKAIIDVTAYVSTFIGETWRDGYLVGVNPGYSAIQYVVEAVSDKMCRKIKETRL